MKYEFLVITLKGGTGNETATLNLYGQMGWELVAVIPYPYERLAYLQRRISEQ
jgi:hypothetical protein